MRSMHQYCQGKNGNRYICMLNNIRFSRLIDVNRKPSGNQMLFCSSPQSKGQIFVFYNIFAIETLRIYFDRCYLNFEFGFELHLMQNQATPL